MAQYVQIQTEFQLVEELLKNLGKQGKSISRYVLRNIGRITKNKIKKSYNIYLHKQSGDLYKSIKSYQSKRALYNVISANATDDKSKVRYAYVLASGSTIQAKNKKYLTFNVNGKWVKKKSVKIPANDFMETPATKYLKSTQMKQDMDKYLQKKLDQLEKKGKITVERVNE